MRRASAWRSQAGLSLVELVVAIAIAGIMLALMFNGQSMLANRRLIGAARNLASDVRMLEQRARTERVCYRIVFAPAANTYTMEQYTGVVTLAPAGGGDQCQDSSWSVAFKEDASASYSRLMPRDVDLVSTGFPSNTLTFSPLGNPPSAGDVTLRTPSGQTRIVRIEVVGRVTILP